MGAAGGERMGAGRLSGAGCWVLWRGRAMEPAAFGQQMAQELWLSVLGREQTLEKHNWEKKRSASPC